MRPHGVSSDPSTTEPAKLVVVAVGDTGASLTTYDKQADPQRASPYPFSPITSRPISMRRTSEVPAPIS